jgi:hypothetical protein
MNPTKQKEKLERLREEKIKILRDKIKDDRFRYRSIYRRDGDHFSVTLPYCVNLDNLGDEDLDHLLKEAAKFTSDKSINHLLKEAKRVTKDRDHSPESVSGGMSPEELQEMIEWVDGELRKIEASRIIKSGTDDPETKTPHLEPDSNAQTDCI